MNLSRKNKNVNNFCFFKTCKIAVNRDSKLIAFDFVFSINVIQLKQV